jgi:hypothetical protein
MIASAALSTGTPVICRGIEAVCRAEPSLRTGGSRRPQRRGAAFIARRGQRTGRQSCTERRARSTVACVKFST